MGSVSIIVPIYNVEPYLCKCIDSILAQTDRDFELILVDDGSPDCCGDICDQYSKSDERVSVIHQKNAGLSAARNAGLDLASVKSASDYVTFIDSDDWVENTYLEVLKTGISETGSDVSCASYASVCQGVKHVRQKDRGWNVLTPEEYWSCGMYSSPVSAWAKLYRRKLFDDIRYPVGKVNEDVFTTHRVLFKVDKVAAREVPVYNYCERANSIMGSGWNNKRLDGIEGLERELEFFKARGLERAYLFTQGRLLFAMSEALQHLDKIDAAKASDFRRRIDKALGEGAPSFWENRDFYRNMLPRTYPMRWLLGMVEDAVRNKSRSWLCRESVPIVKLMLDRLRLRLRCLH